MSENVLDQPYAPQYYNVYMKGALIGMCIDILMREESNGNRSMLSLMKELSVKYGKNKPFNDDTIIEEITAMTYPSVGEFLKTHVEGTTPIDYNSFFAKAGLALSEGRVKTNYIQNDGAFIFIPNQEKQTIAFSPAVANNSFWHDNGVKAGDIIKAVDGVELSMATAQQIIGGMYAWQPGQEINVVLDRNGEEVIIQTPLTQSYTTGSGLMPTADATEAQNAVRNAWLKG